MFGSHLQRSPCHGFVRPVLLPLKVLLVPTFLLLLTLVGRYFGPRMAGWLAGLPVVAGPILFVIALENGSPFAAAAATASTAAVFASVAFGLAYAHAAKRYTWPVALTAALLAWTLAASALALLPRDPWLSLAVALATLTLAPAAFPAAVPETRSPSLSIAQVLLRMGAGAALTLAVSAIAATVGSRWSGLLAVFPVLGIVLAVFSHRAHGAAFASALLRAMATGLYSFAAFCSVLALALQHTTVPAAFAIAAGTAIAVQAATRRQLTLRPS